MQPRIQHYDFGEMVVDDRVYRSDLVILPSGRVVSDWWRLEGHRLQLPDIRDFLGEDFDAVVIGTGYSGLMRVDQEVLEVLRSRAREVHVYDTRRAVEVYNKLVSEGKRVLAMFHLTC